MAASGTQTLNGNKWQIQGFKGKNDIALTISDQKQSVLILKCEQSVVTIKGKVTSVSVDNCKKLGVVFDSVIATAEIVNSQSVQLQANGAVPSVTVDKSQGATIFLQAAEGKNVEIVTSSSTEVNVVTPGKTPDSDPIEQSIPFQFVTKFNAAGKLETKPVEHVGV